MTLDELKQMSQRLDLAQLAWLLDLLQKPGAGKSGEDDRENFASFGRGITDESELSAK